MHIIAKEIEPTSPSSPYPALSFLLATGFLGGVALFLPRAMDGDRGLLHGYGILSRMGRSERTSSLGRKLPSCFGTAFLFLLRSLLTIFKKDSFPQSIIEPTPDYRTLPSSTVHYSMVETGLPSSE
jgi:hypothetical protein